VLYREGAEAQHMYILLQGSLRHTALTTTVPEASELQAVDTLLPAPAPCSLLPAHCSLLTAHCTLLTAHCSLLTTQTVAGGGEGGVHGLAVGTETLTQVSRMTTATALTNCRLLQFSAIDMGLSAADLMREFVRAELYATQGSNPRLADSRPQAALVLLLTRVRASPWTDPPYPSSPSSRPTAISIPHNLPTSPTSCCTFSMSSRSTTPASISSSPASCTRTEP
jgi:hypothetical protein